MTQPIVHVRVAQPEYVIKWLRQLFDELRLLKKNKISIELVRPDTGKPYIQVTRRG